MFCTKCGNELSDDVRFCTRCGAPVESSAATSVETVSTTEVSQASLQKKNKKIVAVIAASAVVVVAALALVFVFLILPSIDSKAETSITEQTSQPEQVPVQDDNSSSSDQGNQNDTSEPTGIEDYSVISSGTNKTYTNKLHGYSVTVPSSYQVTVSDFGDKMTFTDSANDMTIMLTCSNNTDNLSVQQVYDKLAAGKDIAYKFVGSESCVASYLTGDMEYYDKAAVGSGSILYITFKYPHANNATCDKLLEKIVDTIKSGDLSTAHHI